MTEGMTDEEIDALVEDFKKERMVRFHFALKQIFPVHWTTCYW